MCGGGAVYPAGWDNREVRDCCGGTSSKYRLGECFMCNTRLLIAKYTFVSLQKGSVLTKILYIIINFSILFSAHNNFQTTQNLSTNKQLLAEKNRKLGLILLLKDFKGSTIPAIKVQNRFLRIKDRIFSMAHVFNKYFTALFTLKNYINRLTYYNTQV